MNVSVIKNMQFDELKCLREWMQSCIEALLLTLSLTYVILSIAIALQKCNWFFFDVLLIKLENDCKSNNTLNGALGRKKAKWRYASSLC